MTQEVLNKLFLKYKEKLSLILKSDNYNLVLTKNTENEYSAKRDCMEFILNFDKQQIASFSLIPMINCCGILVSTSAYTICEFRNKGIGTILNSLRIDIAKHQRYGLILSTTVEDNVYQNIILKRNKWESICSFINPQTGNTVNINIIKL